MGRYHFVFPQWSNLLLPGAVIFALVAPIYVVFIVAYGFSPKTTAVGYQPVQPVPFSHEIHAGELGMDCRYCHTTVEHASMAAVPPTQTCMNCHTQIVPDSPNVAKLWESYDSGLPVDWIRVHNLPDFSYFDHSIHVNSGVSCVECHGRIDRMDVVYQQEPLSMSWCLECHRNPTPRLREPDRVTDLGWDFDGREAGSPERLDYQAHWQKLNRVQPTQYCSACHR